MKTLYRKELNYYLNNPIGYIIVVLFAAFANFFYIKDIFVVGSASMQPFFNLLPWFFMIFIPAISMRILSEEKRTNTIETLLTLPVTEKDVIVSKFLALMSVVAIGLALTIGLPVSLSFLAKLYLPEILMSYLGALLMAGLFVGISMFFSSLTKNQVIAFLASVIFIFFINVISTDFIGVVLPKFIQDALSYFGPVHHLQNFTKGIFDFRSFLYFVSFILLTVYLTILQLQKRE